MEDFLNKAEEILEKLNSSEGYMSEDELINQFTCHELKMPKTLFIWF